MKLSRNEGVWNCRSGLLFIDQPIGVGFSIAQSAAEIPTNEYTFAAHLFYALQSFLVQNPSFLKRPIFLTGKELCREVRPCARVLYAHTQLYPRQICAVCQHGHRQRLTDPRIQWVEATMKNLELVMYIYKTSGVATLLDIRRTCMYHHRE
ncbi:hypothetical protein M758_UG333100 [Ceratodon purpureus]|nr:hypothetical protein M758_UG333100 [Ceratodon purpureus]